MKTCTVEVNGVRCERVHKAKGRCLLHWKRRRLGIPDTQPIRKVSGWSAQPGRRGEPCKVTGCGRKVRSRGLCCRHLAKWQKDPGNWSGPILPHPAALPVVQLADVTVPEAHVRVLQEEAERRGIRRSFLIREGIALLVERIQEERRQEALDAKLHGKWRRSA